MIEHRFYSVEMILEQGMPSKKEAAKETNLFRARIVDSKQKTDLAFSVPVNTESTLDEVEWMFFDVLAKHLKPITEAEEAE